MRTITSNSNGVSRSFKVLMYSDDILGLGHLRRNSLIGGEFLKRNPGSNVLMLTGLPSGVFFDIPDGADIVKLPSIRKVDTGIYQARTLDMDNENVARLRGSVIKAVIKSYRPDVFLVDHMPLGVWDELRPIFKWLKARPGMPRLVLGLRDIMDAPEVTRSMWQRKGYHEAVEAYYDQILIYGCPSVFETDRYYDLSGAMAEKTSYCGYVSADSGVNDLDLLRRKFKIDAEKLIVVTAGGGFDGYAMMDTCLEAVRTLAGQRSVGVLMVTGPQMPSDHRALLCRKAKGLPVRVEQHLDHLSDYFRAADLVVTMAGYNTLLEAMSAGVPTVVIPRSGPSAEQRMRANIFAERGLLQMIDPEEVTSQDLGRILNAKLEEPRQVRQPAINMNGLAGTIKHLSELADRSHSEKALNKTRFGEPAADAERLARPA